MITIQQDGGFPLTLEVVTIPGTTTKVVESIHHQSVPGLGDLPKIQYYNIKALPEIITTLQKMYDENKD